MKYLLKSPKAFIPKEPMEFFFYKLTCILLSK